MARFTPQQLTKLYEQTLNNFREQPEQWLRFLDTAARLYKYDFPSQVMIFSQRPDAAACADLPFWGNRTQRRINRGATGIGILTQQNGQPRVKYVFDISDTAPRADTVPPPYIWQLRPDAQETVMQNLSARIGEDMQILDSFADNLFMSAQTIAFRMANAQSRNIDFIRAAVSSTAYCVLRRCGIDPAPYVRRISLDALSGSELALLGSITQSASKSCLSSIEQTMKHVDGCKLFRFTTRNRIADKGEPLYNKGTKNEFEPGQEGAVLDGRENRGSVLQQGAGRQDVPRRGAAGVRDVGTDAVGVSENTPAGRVHETAPGRRAEPSPELRGAPGDIHDGSYREPIRESGRRDRGAEGPQSDGVGRSDEQLPARSRESGGGNHHPLNTQTAAGPQTPAAVSFEQMSLMDQPGSGDVFQSNTSASALPSDVFDRNTPDVPDDVIRRVLSAGGNGQQSRLRIAAFFMQDEFRPEDAAIFLRSEYGTGGKGIRLNGIDYAVWFDRDGLRIARGQDTRTPRAAVLSYEQAAQQIAALLQSGQYATSEELANAKSNEYHELASSIWSIYHDRSEDAVQRGFFTQTAALADGIYPPAVEQLTHALENPAQRAVLAAELDAYAKAVQTDETLYRFRFSKDAAVTSAARLQRTEHMTKLYAAADGFQPARAAFITQDEIDQMLCRGSGVSQGKQRIYSYFSEDHTQADRIRFLKDEYGIGGFGYIGYNENHDGRGISFERSENGHRYDKVALSWSQVEHQLRTIIRQNRYFTPEEQAKYERDRTDAATLSDPQPDVFQGNTPEETVQAAAADPAHDVFQGNTPEEPVQAAAADPAHDVFQGNTPEEAVQAAAADPAHDVFQGNTPVNLPLDTADYQLLSRLQSDCDYFLNAGGRSEKHLWAGTVSAQIHKMRELYDALPVKPEWITSDAIDSYEQRMSPRYQVVAYHHTENGFDEKLEYQTQGEAERAAQAYVHGTMESDGFAYDGAAVYDLMEKRYLNAYGSFPDQRAQPQKDAVQDNVFQGNTPEEAVQADAADLPYGSAFDLDTLEKSAQLINSYCNEEFGTDADLSDSSNIGLGYSTTEDEQHEIQITANLPAQAIYYTVDQDVVHTIQCDSLSELNTYLANLSFSELIADAEHFYYEKHPQETPNHDVFQRNTSADNTIMVRCDWSESAAFVDGKIYSVAEFDRLMKDAEDAHAEGRAAAMKMYGSWDNALAADDAEAIHYFGYDKTKFTLLLPDGRTFTERQDIGDGHGGLLDFLSQYSTYADIMPTLEEAVQAAAADPAHDVFQGNTLEEAVQTAAADPAHDVFQGNTLEEAVQAAAADPAHDVFHPNTQNFRITDDALGTGTLAQKFDGNISAIRLLKSLEAEHRPATAEEQTLLSQYVGWGGMANAFSPGNRRYEVLRSLLTEDEYKAARASVLNAHYTAPVVIRAIYDAVHHMGFDGGKILEPAMGTGNFFGLLPEHMADSQLTGVELDSITGRIARKLYPNADIKITGYENTRFADHSFDLAVGNVPFGDYSLHDRRYDKDHLLIHDYFFIKTLDKVRPGGLVALVTSKGTLDKTNPAARRLMAERADLLGAIRLPNTAFKANAGTNVTADILFLQKRDAPPQQLPPWTETGKNADGMELNNYFLQHPEMILGTMQEVTTQYGKDTACIPFPDSDLHDLLTQAVRQLGHGNVFRSNTQITDDVFPSNTPAPALPENMDVFHSNTSAEVLRPYSYTMQDGRLMFKDAQENLIPAEKNATATKRAVGLIAVRDAARQLIEAQRDGCNDARLHTLQGELNQRYDAFVKAFGNIHMRGNKLAFHDDASYPLLLALEKLDEEQNVTGKSDIFSKRTISPHIAVSHADTPEDALGLSLTERGQIDFTYMSSLLDGMPQEQITSALQQQIFRDPSTDSWQPADEYLSGNVRAKLGVARRAAENDPSFAVNVKMLEQVQPAPLTASDISVRLGTTWIPPEDINQFVREVLHPPLYAADKINVSYSNAAKRWYVANKFYDKDTHSLAYTKYGTSRVSGYELLELSLNLRDIQVMDVKIVDGKEKRIPNTKETVKARAKQDALRQAFKDWIFDDPARRERLVGYYNEHFNTTRPREFDGSHLTFPGINPEITLRKHQRDAVARVLYGGNALLAHCVGAGKTWTMAAAAMELRRLGLSHKPMFVVPNSLTEQWGAEFQQLYPGANILVATEADFAKANRKAFCARIATGDYDAVIIGHTQFEKIPLSPENERKPIEKQIDTLELSITEAKRTKDLNFTVRQLESSKKKLETRLKTLMDAKVKDDVITFEELGVDHLFVDEADEFKNLALYTKMRNVGGISNSAAQKSEDMLAKCEYLNEKTGYRGICFATGTPVSNSMTELYTMMRYLQADTLENIAMSDFDSWASNFGETVTAMELAPEGTGYRTKTRFAKFCNLPELISLWRQAADIQTADMLHLPRPEAEYHNVKAQPTPEQQAMVQSLGKRADHVRSGAVAPYEDNMLAITNDGRKLALDQRLADPSLQDDPDSKLNLVVKNVYDTWERSADTKGTQLIFCDLATPSASGKGGNRFCAYDDIRDKLIAKGVPAGEIAYIHDADTPAKKIALSHKMKSGTIRVLIGSTAKMGAGFNVQDRLIALHHVDCPWRPRDVEQREGRILRQGNTNKKVHIYRYVTEGTFDSYNWQTVENKQKFISQVVTGKSPARTCDDIDDAALSYAEVKALAAGDPEIKERMELEVDVNKLTVLRSAYQNDQYKLQDDVNKNIPDSIVKKEKMLAALRQDSSVFRANTAQADGETFRMEIGGTAYTAKDKAGAALLTLLDAERKKILNNLNGKLSYDELRPVGSYCGFRLELERSATDDLRIRICGETIRKVEPGESESGCIRRINNALKDIDKFITDQEYSLSRLQEQLAGAKEKLGKPWPMEDEYQRKIRRLNELSYKMSHSAQTDKDKALDQPVLER